MKHKIPLFALAATIFFVQSISLCDRLIANDTIRVAMRSARLSVSSSEISVGDVCDVQGGSVQQRKQISALDLDVVQAGASTVVTKQQVGVRIALAGVDRNLIAMFGPDNVEVNLELNEDLQQRVESKLSAEISAQFGIPAIDVRVRLLDLKTLVRLREGIETTNFQAMAFFPAQLPLGDKYIQVEFSDTDGGRQTQNVQMQIVILRKVFVTSGIVSKGTVISAEHVQNIKRPMIDNSIELAGAECIGCIANRDIPPHEIVTTRHLSKQPAKKPAGVKRNDLVDILFTRGPLRIRVKNAKVMSNGSRGETVRVLNTNSNKQINAVVADRSTVVVRN